MATQALYLKWRPQRFEDVIGQEHIMRTLRGAIRLDRIRHAYLFSGPRGTGKTTTARLLAKAVNCLESDVTLRPCNRCDHCRAINSGRFLDIIEIDAASHTGVDDVRDLRDKIAFAPNEGRYKVYIIDEVHRFSGAAFDALLKTLEEPPDHAIFVLATTEIHKVPDTIKSRCLVFEFRRVSVRELAAHLRNICDAEGISIDNDVLDLVARQGTGSVRDSISLLDQIVTDPDEHVTYQVAQNMLGSAGSQYVWDVVDAVMQNNTAFGLDQINTAIDTGADPRQFGRQIVTHLRRLLLIRMGNAHLVDASEDELNELTTQAQQFDHRLLLHAIRTFNTAVDDLRAGWQPQLPLELAIVDSTLGYNTAVSSAPPPAERPPQSNRKPSPPKVDPPSTVEVTERGIDFTMFRNAWDALVKTMLDAKPHMSAVIAACRPLRVDGGNTLVVGLQDANLRPQLEQRWQWVKDAVVSVFGNNQLDVRLELVQDTANGDDSAGTMTLIHNDEFFTHAVNEFGVVIRFIDNDLPERNDEHGKTF